MVEVNYDTGFAAFNGPVYLGAMLPILPNEIDALSKDLAQDISTAKKEGFEYVNVLRKKAELPPLTEDATLNSIALVKANDMAEHDYIGHTDSNGGTISETAKKAGIHITGRIGENV